MESTKTAFGFSRQIGTTLYRTSIHCSSTSTESFEEKLLRLIRHEALDIFGGCGIMKAPQMSRQSERSAIYGCQAG